jgi:hypothetical protein
MSSGAPTTRASSCWGAPRIHGELLKLGFELSESTVATYVVRHRRPPSQTWRTFLKNHAKTLVSSHFFVVPTVFFRVLFVFVILSHDRRRPVHVAVTEYPTSASTHQNWQGDPQPRKSKTQTSATFEARNSSTAFRSKSLAASLGKAYGNGDTAIGGTAKLRWSNPVRIQRSRPSRCSRPSVANGPSL